MTSILRPHVCALVVVCFAFSVGGTGCAMRATTDFGPQTADATHSISAGSQVLPGEISGTSGPAGESVGLHGGTGNTFDGAGVSAASNNDPSALGGAR